jgi:maltose alpha-D-glucosyltransferase/alpha-amylase
LIQTLGQRTGELHNALHTTTGDAAFDPEPVTASDLAAWVAHVDTELRATLDQLDHRLAGLADKAKELAQQLLAQRGVLADSLQHCISKPCIAIKSRYHGDYHLGQVLLTGKDFVIIDFEGEPSRSLIERRRKHSPLRDVAGMLLSFNYAAQTALAHECVEQEESVTRISPLLVDWEAEVSKVFLAAYATAVHEVGAFEESSPLQGLLDLFRLEKLFYEVRYELDNRPEWVVIPLRGIVELMNKRGLCILFK